jgi:hypothetical protein
VWSESPVENKVPVLPVCIHDTEGTGNGRNNSILEQSLFPAVTHLVVGLLAPSPCDLLDTNTKNDNKKSILEVCFSTESSDQQPMESRI